MPSSDDDLKLAAEFPAPTRAEWLKLVEGVLKGADFDKKLVTRTYDGLRIEPIYPRAVNALPVTGRAAAQPWQVVARIDLPDAASANGEALHELENGANGLALVFAGSPNAYGFGLPPTRAALEAALKDVHLEANISLDLMAGSSAQNMAEELAAIVRERGIDPSQTHIRFGIDPIGASAFSGQSPLDWNTNASTFATNVKALADQGFAGPFATANGTVIHNAGGSEAQELAFAIASALAYLRALEASGTPLEQARGMIAFRLAADADQFMTMAKFRALRKLWARIGEACGLPPTPAVVSAETAWRMLTQRDPYVNMLRATIATVAAGLGGADAITVLPHTLALGLPNRFARRMARNTQLILLEESNLAKVSDPAAGSGGIEDLTAKLSAAAWSLFQEIEKAGGVFAALASGLIQGKVAETRKAHEANVARRKDPLTGASEFPNIHEEAVAVLDAHPAALPPAAEAKVKFPALASMRLAEPFEKLRDWSDGVRAKRGSRPKIFLANLGTAADFTARTTFAKNFFEAGGIEAVNGESEAKDLAAAFQASGAQLACLCSSDAVYAEAGAEASAALKQAGALHLYLAGRGGDAEQALRAAGVETFVYAGMDVLSTLQAACDILNRLSR